MSTRRPFIIGTRGSALALWQAHHIADRLAAIGQPTERRVASSSSTRPMVATTMSVAVGCPGRVASSR